MLRTHYRKFFLNLALVGIYSAQISAEGGPPSGARVENTYANTSYGYNSSSYSSSSSNDSGCPSPVRG